MANLKSSRLYLLYFGMGLLLLLLLSLLFPGNKQRTSSTYSSIATAPTKVFQVLNKPSVDQKALILVLYKNDCKYCKKIEKPVVQKIQKVKGEKNIPPFLVLNLNKCSRQQKTKLSQKILDLAPNQRLLTPTFAIIKNKGGGQWQVTKIYSGTDLSKIKNIIGDS